MVLPCGSGFTRPQEVNGEMRDREDYVEALKRLANRLGIPPSTVKVRPLEGSPTGMTLSFIYQDVRVSRSCDCGASRDENFGHLVNWMADLVKNIERRIETLEEALHADGVGRLPAKAGVLPEIRENRYRGTKDLKTSVDLVRRTLGRLGMSENDLKLSWSSEKNEARLRLRVRCADGSERVMEKVSERQDDAAKNVASLALWLQERALHVERGIETMERVASAYLLGDGR